MTENSRTKIDLARASGREAISFDISPAGGALKALAEELKISAVRKARLAGTLSPVDQRDWRLEAVIGATVVQPCVVTLDPVTTRIDEPVFRTYLAEYTPPEGAEVEMDEDDTIEPLPAVVDLASMRDALVSMNADATKANPLLPVDLVIDHSVQVDKFGSVDAAHPRPAAYGDGARCGADPGRSLSAAAAW